MDSRDLNLSELYFAVIQMLRTSTDWICESMNDLDRIVDEMEQQYFSPNMNRTGPPSPHLAAATFLPPSTEPAAQEAAIQVFRHN